MVDVCNDNLDYEDEAIDRSPQSFLKNKTKTIHEVNDDYESGEASFSESGSLAGSEDGELVSESDDDQIEPIAHTETSKSETNGHIHETIIYVSGNEKSASQEDDEVNENIDNAWTRGLKAAKERLKRAKELKLSDKQIKDKQMNLRAPVKEFTFVGSSIDIYMDQEEIKVNNPIWTDYYSHYHIGHTPTTWRRFIPCDVQDPPLGKVYKWRKIIKRANKTNKTRFKRYATASSSSGSSDSSSGESNRSLSPLSNESDHLESIFANYLVFPSDPKNNSHRRRSRSESDSDDTGSGSSSSSSISSVRRLRNGVRKVSSNSSSSGSSKQSPQPKNHHQSIGKQYPSYGKLRKDSSPRHKSPLGQQNLRRPPQQTYHDRRTGTNPYHREPYMHNKNAYSRPDDRQNRFPSNFSNAYNSRFSPRQPYPLQHSSGSFNRHHNYPPYADERTREPPSPDYRGISGRQGNRLEERYASNDRRRLAFRRSPSPEKSYHGRRISRSPNDRNINKRSRGLYPYGIQREVSRERRDRGSYKNVQTLSRSRSITPNRPSSPDHMAPLLAGSVNPSNTQSGAKMTLVSRPRIPISRSALSPNSSELRNQKRQRSPSPYNQRRLDTRKTVSPLYNDRNEFTSRRRRSSSPRSPNRHRNAIHNQNTSRLGSSGGASPIAKRRHSPDDRSPYDQVGEESTEDRLRALRERLALVNDAIADITSTKH